jgi:hypothetical protein
MIAIGCMEPLFASEGCGEKGRKEFIEEGAIVTWSFLGF